MTPERWKRIGNVFAEALEREDDERAAYLDGACEGDAELRAEVDALLAAAETRRSFFTDPVAVAAKLLPGGEADSAVGATLDGKYRITGVIGKGGMGAVYRATHLQLEREVAVKVIHYGALAGEAAEARFRREALAVARLRHPNVVTVHDVGVAPAVGAYIVMEYVAGQSLRHELRERRRLAAVEVIAIMRQVLAGVAAAHRAGIVHRDLKPENVVLEQTPDGLAVKVLDFGIAKLQSASSDGSHATAAHTIVGTPAYMSPEQIAGDEVDARSDTYSIGCMLYEALAGRPPFEAARVEAMFFKHVHETPAPIGAPATLERIVLRAMAKRPDERFQTAEDFARALQAEASGEGETLVMDVALATSPTGMTARAGEAWNNLPAPATSFVGGRWPVREVVRLLEETRLLTLTGPGGVGKTRLALEAARDLLDTFADGVYVVELAAVSEPGHVVPAVAQTLGVKIVSSTPDDALAAALATRRLLLVLDNLEQVLDAAPLVADLLARTSNLKVIATSRAPLRVRAETEYEVLPLELPDMAELPASANLEQYGAVALFAERARRLDPSFEITAANAWSVAEICARLDGLPLAIELAAARTRLLAPEALLAKLDRRLKLLTAGARDLPARQQTMRGAIGWSYDLLGEAERRLFRRLSVFAGGATLEAVEAVCGVPASDGDELDALDLVASLLEKSLIRRAGRGDAARLAMLETIREYAGERLDESPEADDVRRRHAAYFEALSAQSSKWLKSAGAAEWLETLDREHDNFRAALSWAIERDGEAALRLTSELRNFWQFHNHYAEGLAWIERAVAASPASRSTAKSRALRAAGTMLIQLGDYDRSRAVYEQALEIAREHGDPEHLIASLLGTANACLAQGEFATARALHEEALTIPGGSDGLRGASILNNLGEGARAEGDYALARSYYLRAVETARAVMDTQVLSVALINLGFVDEVEGRDDEALACHREALEIAERIGDRHEIALGLLGVASVLARRDAAGVAARLLGASDAIYAAIGAEVDPADRPVRDRAIAATRDRLGDEAFLEATGAGRALTASDAIALAIG